MINLTIPETENLINIILHHVEDGKDVSIEQLNNYYNKLSRKTKYSGIAYRIIFLNNLLEFKDSVDFNRSWSLDKKSAMLFLEKRKLDGEIQNAYLLKAKIKGIKVNPIVNEIQDYELIQQYSNENEVIATEIGSIVIKPL